MKLFIFLFILAFIEADNCLEICTKLDDVKDRLLESNLFTSVVEEFCKCTDNVERNVETKGSTQIKIRKLNKLKQLSIYLNDLAKSIAFFDSDTSILILNISASIIPSEQSFYLLGDVYERRFDFGKAKENYEKCNEMNNSLCKSDVFRLIIRKNEELYYRSDPNMMFRYLFIELIENKNEKLFQQLLLPYLRYYTPQQFHSYLISFFNVYNGYNNEINAYSKHYSLLPFLFPHTSIDDILIQYFEYYINNLQKFISDNKDKIDNYPVICYIRTNLFEVINLSIPKFYVFFYRLHTILNSVNYLHGISSHCKSENEMIDNEIITRIGFYLSSTEDFDIDFSFQKIIELLPFEHFQRVVIIPPESKYIVEKYFGNEEIVFVEISKDYDLSQYRNVISELELDVLIYQNVYSDWINYLLSFNRLANIQIVYTNYLPIVASDSIDYILFCERKQSFDGRIINTQIVGIESNDGFYKVPNPIPIINKTKVGFDESSVIISIPFHYHYDDLFISVVKKIVDEYENANMIILYDKMKVSVNDIYINNEELFQFNNKVKYYGFSNVDELSMIYTIIDINLNPFYETDLSFYLHTLFNKKPTVNLSNQNYKNVISHFNEMIKINQLNENTPELYYAVLKELIENKDIRSRIYDSLKIERYLIFNDTSLIDELYPFLTFLSKKMNKEITIQSQFDFINPLLSFGRYDTCAQMSWLITSIFPSSSILQQAISHCFKRINENLNCLKRLRLSFYYNPLITDLYNSSVIIDSLNMNETNGWIGKYKTSKYNRRGYR